MDKDHPQALSTLARACDLLPDGSMTYLDAIRQDMSLGYRTREIMERRELSWSQLRPIQELIAPAEVTALRKQRLSQLALESAETMSEQLASSHGSIEAAKLPAAIKTMLDVAQLSAGEATEIKEVRHTIDLSNRNQSLADLRKAAAEAAQDETAIEVDAEVVEGENEE